MKAVFLDRDGVINKLVYNFINQEYEPPFYPSDIEVYPDVIDSLKKLQSLGYYLFIISNQPDFSKGKTTLKNLLRVHEEIDKIFRENNIEFKDFFYCFHHPIVEECVCRKPSPYFIINAIERYGLDKEFTWMIGDRKTDIECGLLAGVKTISVRNISLYSHYNADNLEEAVKIIEEDV